MFVLSSEDFKDLICQSAALGVRAACALQGRKEDDISERKAIELYGKAWLKDRTKRGLLHFNRVGATERSSKVYSIFEIESLKIAEKYQDKYKI
jgi:hypothetical protein